MNWLRKLLDRIRGKPSPEPKTEPQQAGDPDVDRVHQEWLKRKGEELERGESQHLEDV